MSLMNCPTCGHENIPDNVVSCPKCQYNLLAHRMLLGSAASLEATTAAGQRRADQARKASIPDMKYPGIRIFWLVFLAIWIPFGGGIYLTGFPRWAIEDILAKGPLVASGAVIFLCLYLWIILIAHNIAYRYYVKRRLAYAQENDAYKSYILKLRETEKPQVLYESPESQSRRRAQLAAERAFLTTKCPNCGSYKTIERRRTEHRVVEDRLVAFKYRCKNCGIEFSEGGSERWLQ